MPGTVHAREDDKDNIMAFKDSRTTHYVVMPYAGLDFVSWVTKRRANKVPLVPGQHVRAKWTDGKMYYATFVEADGDKYTVQYNQDKKIHTVSRCDIHIPEMPALEPNQIVDFLD